MTKPQPSLQDVYALLRALRRHIAVSGGETTVTVRKASGQALGQSAADALDRHDA